MADRIDIQIALVNHGRDCPPDVNVIPAQVHVNKGVETDVYWHLPGGTLALEFSKPPFAGKRYDGTDPGHLHIKAGATPGTYSYSVKGDVAQTRIEILGCPEIIIQ